jgi:hypothetical protein
MRGFETVLYVALAITVLVLFAAAWVLFDRAVGTDSTPEMELRFSAAEARISRLEAWVLDESATSEPLISNEGRLRKSATMNFPAQSEYIWWKFRGVESRLRALEGQPVAFDAGTTPVVRAAPPIVFQYADGTTVPMLNGMPLENDVWEVEASFPIEKIEIDLDMGIRGVAPDPPSTNYLNYLK